MVGEVGGDIMVNGCEAGWILSIAVARSFTCWPARNTSEGKLASGQSAMPIVRPGRVTRSSSSITFWWFG